MGLALGSAWLLYPRPADDSGDLGVTEIVYWAHFNITDASKAAVREFERRHPEYRVVIGQATARDMVGDPTRFLLGVAGNVPPDLIYFDRFAIVEWASRGAFTDLTPLLERDHDAPNGIHEEDFFAPAWKEPIYKGRNYAVANSADTRAMYYNGDALIRAGFTYKKDDAEVIAGDARPGQARPPQTWEEMCRKTLHAWGDVEADGSVTLSEFVRRPAINEEIAEGAAVELGAIRPGDVIALVSGKYVFRGRVAEVTGADSLRIDLSRDQAADFDAIPLINRGKCEVKVYDQDGYVCRLTRFSPDDGQMTSVGFIPLFGNSWLYMFGWLNGASFMSDDGSECRLDSPEIVVALQWLQDVYDAMGGYETANVFQASALSGALDPFLTGKIALRIDGDWFMQTIMAFKPDLNFGVVGSPIPQARFDAGFESVGWGGGFAYAIPSTAKHKAPAWELAKWLLSVEANQMSVEYDASLRRAQGQTYFPRLHPDRRVVSWLKQKFIEENPAITPNLAKAYDRFSELLPRSKYRPVTPVGQKLWGEHKRATEAAVNHQKHPYEALNYGKRQTQQVLERVLNPPDGPRMPWGWVIALYVGAIVSLAIGVVVIQERKRRLYGGKRVAWFEGIVCASPWLIGFAVFGGGPIIFSLIISFCHYDVLTPARFIGLENYIQLMGRHHDAIVGAMVWNDPLFWKSLGNTAYMIIGVPLGILAGLAIALLLDSKVRGLHVYRTIYYMPAIVPAVAAFILWIWIFDPSRGMLNQILRTVGIGDPPNWLQNPDWAKPSLILMGLWGVGASMIIWLAGLKDIPESLYEAASIDGANRLQRFRHITIPLLTPYILFNMVMGMIGVFQIFEAAFVMTDGGPADATLFYAYKLFNEAFRYLNMGVASAMAWVLFLVVLVITMFQLWMSKKWVYYGGE